jgi:hypothetical protein
VATKTRDVTRRNSTERGERMNDGFNVRECARASPQTCVLFQSCKLTKSDFFSRYRCALLRLAFANVAPVLLVFTRTRQC